MVAYEVTTRREVELQRMRQGLLVVSRYERPEATAGGILIPETYRTDKTQTLWEVVMPNPEAAEVFGMVLGEGDNVVTPRRWPVDLALETEEGYRLFALRPQEVRNVIKRTW